MSREFIIGAMNLTPYFVRRERELYIFRDVPDALLRSLMAYSRSNELIAFYINPKVYFSTQLFTNEPYPDGVLFMAHYHGVIHPFFVRFLDSFRETYWVEGV